MSESEFFMLVSAGMAFLGMFLGYQVGVSEGRFQRISEETEEHLQRLREEIRRKIQ